MFQILDSRHSCVLVWVQGVGTLLAIAVLEVGQ